MQICPQARAGGPLAGDDAAANLCYKVNWAGEMSGMTSLAARSRV